jgi:hypothetical protein
MILLDPNEHPECSSLINEFKKWNRRGESDSKGAAIFLLTYLHLSKKLSGQPDRPITRLEAIETYQYVKNYMLTNFDRMI